MLVTPGSERVIKSCNQYVNLYKVLLETSYMNQYVLYSFFLFSCFSYNICACERQTEFIAMQNPKVLFG